MKPRISEAFYRSLFENIVDGLAYCQVIFDASGRPVDFKYIHVNKNFQKLTGLKGVTGKKVSEIIPEILVSNPELIEICSRVALHGEPKKFEVYVEPLLRWFFVSVYSTKKSFFVAAFQNITDRKNTEKNLEDAKIAARNVLDDLNIEKIKVEAAQAKEEAILLSIGDGLVATDSWGSVMLINKTAEKLLGTTSEEVMGKVFSDVIQFEDEKGVPVSAENHPVETALVSKDKTPPTAASAMLVHYSMKLGTTKFPAAIMATPVILDQKVIGSIVVFRDITREKEIDRAKTEFVSLASHQLRTPLTTISWYTEMILNGAVGAVTSNQKKYLEEIYSGNRRMIELVNTLLDVSRIELGTLMSEPRLSDVVVLAKSVLDEQKLQIEQKKLVLKLEFDTDIPLFLTDTKLLRMVFQNLLTNAVEYTPDGGRIEFSIRFEHKKTISIRISDTGYGIPKNQQDQIFTKLFRADNVRAMDTDGTGLGLYIIKSFILDLGGKIWFESEENKGTTFYVTLPLDGVKKKPVTRVHEVPLKNV